jgi:hypothetical protein
MKHLERGRHQRYEKRLLQINRRTNRRISSEVPQKNTLSALRAMLTSTAARKRFFNARDMTSIGLQPKAAGDLHLNLHLMTIITLILARGQHGVLSSTTELPTKAGSKTTSVSPDERYDIADQRWACFCFVISPIRLVTSCIAQHKLTYSNVCVLTALVVLLT